MQIIRGEGGEVGGEDSEGPGVRAAVLAIGNFDGLHRGHQAVIATTVDAARERGARAGLLTFEPHPRTFFAPHNPVFRITSVDLKWRLVSALGIDFMAVSDFDQSFAALAPERFVEDVLVKELSAVHVVTGADFRFGRARAGDIDALRGLGASHGFSVSAVSPVGDPGAERQSFSSTSVRQALLHGNPRAAAEILGYWWTVLGEVVHGDQIGHTLGFPTVNIAMDETSAPRLGLYGVRVRAADRKGGEVWQGAGYVGRRPTFGKEDVVLEVFLLDFSGDLYGRVLMIEFIEFIRGDEAFADGDALKAQMELDCAAARRLLDALEGEGDPMRAYPIGRAQAEGRL